MSGDCDVCGSYDHVEIFHCAFQEEHNGEIADFRNTINALIAVGAAARAYREGFMARDYRNIPKGEPNYVYHNRLGVRLDDAINALDPTIGDLLKPAPNQRKG